MPAKILPFRIRVPHPDQLDAMGAQLMAHAQATMIVAMGLHGMAGLIRTGQFQSHYQKDLRDYVKVATRCLAPHADEETENEEGIVH